MKLGHVTIYLGATLQTIYAEEKGLLLMIFGISQINKGEVVSVIAKLE